MRRTQSQQQMNDLILLKKAEVFLNNDVYPILKHFPQAEKFSLCQEIKQSLYRIIKISIMSKNATDRGKLKFYRDIDAELKLQLVFFSVARTQKYITERKALYLQRKITELGKITGGLIKSIN